MNKPWTERFLLAINVVAAVALLFMLFRPSGPLGRRFADWIATRRAAAYAREHSPEIVNGAPVLGNAAHPQMVMFTDYECPFCKGEHATLQRFLASRSNTGIAVRHFPLPFHPHAMNGAIAAVCANEAGRFTQMDDFLFTDTSWISNPDWGLIAKKTGIEDTTAFHRCVEGDSAVAIVKADIAMGRRLHVTGTPTFVSGDEIMPGSLPEWMLDSLVRRSAPVLAP